jgi:hypothetical protein
MVGLLPGQRRFPWNIVTRGGEIVDPDMSWLGDFLDHDFIAIHDLGSCMNARGK